MRVLCFGGRDFTDKNFIYQKLDQLHSHFLTLQPAGVLLVIHGGARGADSLSGMWGASKGLPVICFPAPWDFYGKAAGSVRNQWMLDFAAPTYAVQFPGGRGTADMASRCKAAGLTPWVAAL